MALSIGFSASFVVIPDPIEVLPVGLGVVLTGVLCFLLWNSSNSRSKQEDDLSGENTTSSTGILHNFCCVISAIGHTSVGTKQLVTPGAPLQSQTETNADTRPHRESVNEQKPPSPSTEQPSASAPSRGYHARGWSATRSTATRSPSSKSSTWLWRQWTVSPLSRSTR